MSQHVVGSRLTSNIKITLKIKFTSQIFADISRSLVVVLQHLRFCKKILILIFFSDLFSVECKFFCPNSADNTMESRAISLVESSRDNSLISCPTSSDFIMIYLLYTDTRLGRLCTNQSNYRLKNILSNRPIRFTTVIRHGLLLRFVSGPIYLLIGLIAG